MAGYTNRYRETLFELEVELARAVRQRLIERSDRLQVDQCDVERLPGLNPSEPGGYLLAVLGNKTCRLE